MPVQEKGTVRDLGFIAWSDEYAEIEDHQSEIFKETVKEETSVLDDILNKIPKEKKDIWLSAFESLPKHNPEYYSFDWHRSTFSINERSRSNPTVIIKNKKKKMELLGLNGFGINKEVFWTIKDYSKGKESLSLNIYNKDLKNILTIDKVGESASTDETSVYYTEAVDTFWFNKIIKFDVKENKKRTIYVEKDKAYVLRIVKPENQSDIFVTRKNAIYHDIGLIKDGRIEWLSKGFGTKTPISYNSIAYDSHFTIDSQKIEYPDNWKLVDAYIHKNGYVFIFTKDAFHSMWFYDKTWSQISKEQVCEINFSLVKERIIVGYPHKPDAIFKIEDKTLHLEKELGGKTYQSNHGKDNNSIPWFSVQKTNEPKAVVICGYGAYGMSLRKTQQRLWLPWLEQNYMIVNICVRGGGENGDKWWDASRTAERRHVSINDFVNGIDYIQEKFGFSKKNTIIYGRSAGGLLVNAASFKLFNKITAVYAAKPYTDVLRTTSNLKEPQTIQEREEFGLAYNNPVDFYHIIKISPYENIVKIEDNTSNPVILLTAGTNDTEVGPYMPLKYVKRLRDFNWKNVFCRVAKGEGHFTNKGKEDGEALDAAICDYFVS